MNTGNLIQNTRDTFKRTYNISTRSYLYEQKEDVTWKDADYEFDATLIIVSGSYHIYLGNIKTRERYMMFATDWFKMVQEVVIDKGVIRARWGFAKKGPMCCIQYRGPTKE